MSLGFVKFWLGVLIASALMIPIILAVSDEMPWFSIGAGSVALAIVVAALVEKALTR